MLTSNDSLSSDSTKSSESSSILNERRFSLCFEDQKGQENSLNDEYTSLSGKDDRYWERRRKNNAAAKRSRERRRQHDMELEQQIQQLKLINSVLQRELITLRQRMVSKESMMDQIDKSQIYSDDVFIPPLVESTTVSPSMLNEKPIINITENFENISSKSMKEINQNKMSNIFNHQSPIDLSCKLSRVKSETVSKSQPKTIYRSNSQGIIDQKYWDRRRRNNEAVRKCRENKRARINNSVKNSKEDSTQIQHKIESISSELEKLKSHIIHSENSTIDFSIYHTKNAETTISGSKIMKWKTKLIEANQADKAMF